MIKWPSILYNTLLNISVGVKRCESLNQFFSRGCKNTKICLHLWCNFVSGLSEKTPSVYFPLLLFNNNPMLQIYFLSQLQLEDCYQCLTPSSPILSQTLTKSHSESACQEYSDKDSSKKKLQGNWEAGLQLQQMNLVDIWYK